MQPGSAKQQGFISIYQWNIIHVLLVTGHAGLLLVVLPVTSNVTVSLTGLKAPFKAILSQNCLFQLKMLWQTEAVDLLSGLSSTVFPVKWFRVERGVCSSSYPNLKQEGGSGLGTYCSGGIWAQLHARSSFPRWQKPPSIWTVAAPGPPPSYTTSSSLLHVTRHSCVADQASTYSTWTDIHSLGHRDHFILILVIDQWGDKNKYENTEWGFNVWMKSWGVGSAGVAAFL